MRMRNFRSRPRSFSIAAALPQVSLIQGLSIMVGVLIVAYVGLMAFTMSFAVIHTQYAEQARDAEAQVGTLETQYFNAIARVDALDPAALGYVTPASRQFAVIPAAPAVATALNY